MRCMNLMSFFYLCVIFSFLETAISKHNIDAILSMVKIGDYNIRAVQHLPDDFFSFTNADTHFRYSRSLKRSPLPPFLDLEDAECECGEGMNKCLYTSKGKTCDCSNNKIVLNGLCTDCVCHNGLCDAETGVCMCLKGFGLRNNTCVECDCGEKKAFCHFVEGLQFCNCQDQYISVNQRCEDCVCGKDEVCMKRPIGVCICPKGSGIWTDECNDICDCTDGRSCLFLGPQKICTCMPRKAKLDGACIDCDCGANSECEFVEGKKTCTCKDGYELNNGTCEECNCGDGHSCTFRNGSSACLCAENYYEHNGTCHECSCGPNERCEIIDGSTVCICKENFIKMLNDSCSECFCGEGHACDTIDGKKLCLCREGFADNNGKCEKCDCGPNHTSCEFQNGNKQCECREDLVDNNGICQECYCGEGATCFFEKGEKLCVCPDGQVRRNETCKTACSNYTCGRGNCEEDDNGFYCNCEDGYSGVRCDEEAVLSQGAIYLISVLSAVTLFWIILLVVYIIRKRNRYQYYHNEKLDATMNILSSEHTDSAM